MASDKKRRKQAKAKRPTPPPGQPFRHPDGDRRHRAAMQKVTKDMRARQKFEDGVQSDPSEEE